MEREEERGGEERGREAGRVGAAGSQRASRSGLLSRGTGVMSPPIRAESDVRHAPGPPEESRAAKAKTRRDEKKYAEG